MYTCAISISEPVSVAVDSSEANSGTAADQLRLSQSGAAHEELHSLKASSLDNLQTTGHKDVAHLGPSSTVLSTSAPQGDTGHLLGISSTGTKLQGTGLISAPPPSLQSTSSAVSDNVFGNQSDFEDTKGKDGDTDDVFSLETLSESKTEVEPSKAEKKEDKNPTFAKLMEEQRKKSEELKSKGTFTSCVCVQWKCRYLLIR